MSIFTNVDLARFSTLVRDARFPASLLDDGSLLLGTSGNVTTTWAPFDYTPKTVRLVICGITPGRTQAVNALTAFGEALKAGAGQEEALRTAKLTGSFSGGMRNNIVRMLDFLTLHHVFGVSSCADLFKPQHELVHMTSALRYPVFVRGENYNGTPAMLRTPILRGMVEEILAEEARQLPDALWLPLGPKPTEALAHLVKRGDLKAENVLEGMPHPSGANGERIAYFLGEKMLADLSAKTVPGPIDAARERLRKQISNLLSSLAA